MTLISHEPDASYHGMVDTQGRPSLGIHKVLESDRKCGGSLAAYWLRHVRRLPELAHQETEALFVGDATHKHILQPEVFEQRYAVAPEGMNFATTKGKEWKAAQLAAQPERRIIKHDQFQVIQHMAESMRANADAQAILCDGEAELTSRFIDPQTGLTRQCKFDWASLKRGFIGELKTIDDINEMRWDAFKYNYDRQAAWYGEHAAVELGLAWPTEDIRHFIVAVEKQAPWTCQVFRISYDDILIANDANREALNNLANAYETNTWPDNSTGVITLSRPARLAIPLQNAA